MNWFGGICIDHNSGMTIFSPNRWVMPTSTVLVWALATGSIVYWGLQLFSGGSEATSPPVAAQPIALDPLVVARIFGVKAQVATLQASTASRFKLLGVVAGSSGVGAALIAVDGKPAQTFRVGGVVDEGLILQSASARQVTLAGIHEASALFTLDLPSLNK